MLEEKETNTQIKEFENDNTSPFPKHPNFRDWVYRIVLFLVGLVVLDLLALLISIVLQITNPDYLTPTSPLYVKGNTIINTARYIIVLVIFVILLLPRMRKLFHSFKNIKNLIFGAMFGILLLGLSGLYEQIITEYVELEVNGNQVLASQMVKAYPFLSILILGIIGPICEEITYRYGLFSLISKKNKILAYIITILVFAIIHLDFGGDAKTELLNLPSYLIAGVTLCYVYDRYGFSAALVAHVFNNIYSIIAIITN